MSAKSKLLQSRFAWKEKASDRGDDSRDQRKIIGRQSIRIQQQNIVIRAQDKRIAVLEEAASKPSVTVKVEVVFLALRLFVEARISMRAISRVLKILSAVFGGFKAPCPQTISNWVTKLSLTRLWSLPAIVKLSSPCAMFTNGWMYMFDESIGHACGKILLVLRVRADHYATATGYPGFRDIQPVAVAVSTSWTGEHIAVFLQKIIEVCGRPSGYILDGGRNLNKAMSILDGDGIGSSVIRDISHYMANLLEKKYGSNPYLESFLSACGDCAKRLKQSVLACLMPPKVRTKARFMNLHRLIRWAHRVLALSPVGRASSGSMLEKLRNSISTLPQHKLFIERFLDDANVILACQKAIKQNGLTCDSEAACRDLVRAMSNHDPIKLGIIQWLSDNIKIARDLGLQDTGMLASSDSIESVFGLSKTHGVGYIKDPLRVSLKIGAICGDVSIEDARKVIVMPHASLVKAMPKSSLQANRVAILGGVKDIETLNQNSTEPCFCLMPSPKNRDNSLVIEIKSDVYKISSDPPNVEESRAS